MQSACTGKSCLISGIKKLAFSSFNKFLACSRLMNCKNFFGLVPAQSEKSSENEPDSNEYFLPLPPNLAEA
jgi:hypothetical protein